MELIIDHTCRRKPLYNPISIGFGELLSQRTQPHVVERVTQLHYMGAEALMPRTLPALTLCISTCGCSTVSFIIAFNERINK